MSDNDDILKLWERFSELLTIVEATNREVTRIQDVHTQLIKDLIRRDSERMEAQVSNLEARVDDLERRRGAPPIRET